MNIFSRSYRDELIQERSCLKGFTLVELSLSMVFIAILSILIVLIINNAISSYHRGITLNLVNTVGTDVVSDMRKAVQSSSVRSVTDECKREYSDEEIETECKEDMAHNFVLVERFAKVKVGSNELEDVPVFGAFCTGRYSYIWNSGYYFNNEVSVEDGVAKAYLEYHIGDNMEKKEDFKLLKVKDLSMKVCKDAVSKANSAEGKGYSLENKYIDSKFEVTLTGAGEEEISEVLSGSNGVALYDLKAATPAESKEGDSVFYSISMILGTVQGGININSMGNFCATPKGFNSGIANFNYCAINKFNFAAWANGKGE